MKYVRQYKWSNIFTMMKNNLREPEICREKLTGKRVLITGATSGIGYHTAQKYASMGVNLICINRNPSKSEVLREQIERDYGVECRCLIADLGSLDEIFRVSRELIELEGGIDVMIHNAGIYLTRLDISPDGFDRVFAVHYISSFIMTYLLMDKLIEDGKCRIILVGSEGHRFAAWGLRLDDLNWQKRRYSGLKSYGSAKLAQMLSALCFADRFKGSGVTINSMHPGAVKSGTGQENGLLYRWFKKSFFDKLLKTPQISAEALYYLGAAPALEDVSGKFFNLTTLEEPAPPALDKEAAELLWEETLRMTGIKDTKTIG